jgi:hypothetical protein
MNIINKLCIVIFGLLILSSGCTDKIIESTPNDNIKNIGVTVGSTPTPVSYNMNVTIVNLVDKGNNITEATFEREIDKYQFIKLIRSDDKDYNEINKTISMSIELAGGYP